MPLGDPAWNGVEDASDVAEELREEIAHFFSVYASLGGEGMDVQGWGSCDEARSAIAEARKRS